MRPVILFRDLDVAQEEKDAMRRHFEVVESRLGVHPNHLVVGRYSMLPYYAETERDILALGSQLINTTRQHNWIADLGNWASAGGVLEGLTPAAWTNTEFARGNAQGPFVVKGATNSKKQLWATHMFAARREDVGKVIANLLADTEIGQQEIYVRPFVKFFELMKSENDLPIVREFRFFMLRGKVLAGGFYWSSHVDDLRESRYKHLIHASSVPPAFLKNVAERIAPYAPFTAVDVAWTMDERWLVTDVNDGQMSGLSEVDPELFYAALKAELEGEGA